jgi:HK97 family phage portal protein
MGLIKSLVAPQRKFTPASDINWTRVETLIHGPGAPPWDQGDGTGDGNSAVFACLMAIARAYTEPPLRVFRKAGGKPTTHLADHPWQALFNSPTPNGELNIEEIMFWTAWAKNAHGNAYWLKVRAGDPETGNVVELWPVSPTLIKPVTQYNRDGRPREWISYYRLQVAPNTYEDVPVANVIHFRLGIDDDDKRLGMSPLRRLLRHVSTDDEAERFTNALLKNYAVPGLVVIPAGGTTLDETTADRITARLKARFGSDNRGNIAVLSRETKVEQFGFSPQELNLSDIHRIPEERIAAVLGVPAIIAGLGAGLDRSTYSNFQESREAFVEQTLIPQWRFDAARINTALRPDFDNQRRNTIAVFDTSEVRALQEDENEMYARLNSAVAGRWMTVNEARARVNLPPVDGGDELALPEPPPVELLVQEGSGDGEEQPAGGEKALALKARAPDAGERERFELRWRKLMTAYLRGALGRIEDGLENARIGANTNGKSAH